MKKLLIILILIPSFAQCQDIWHKVDSIGRVLSDSFMKYKLGNDFFKKHLCYNKSFEGGLLQTYSIFLNNKDTSDMIIACYLLNKINDHNDVTKNIVLDSVRSNITNVEIEEVNIGKYSKNIWQNSNIIEHNFLNDYPSLKNKKYSLVLQMSDRFIYYMIYVYPYGRHIDAYQYNATTGKFVDYVFTDPIQ